MGSYIFRATWPILDVDRTKSALVAEACRELDAMAAEAGGRITGDPVWAVDGEELICEAPAKLIDNVIPMAGKSFRGTRLPPQVVDDIWILADRGWDAVRIGKQLGVSAKTVRRYQASSRRDAA